MARARYRNNVFTLSGVAVHIQPYAEVAVYDSGTLTPYIGTIYVDEAGPATKSNPFNADQYGNILFYLAQKDEVKLIVQGVGTGEVTLDYEPVPPRPQDVLNYANGEELQAAINAGGPILLGPGVIEVSTTITLAVNTMLIGAGFNQTLFHWTGAENGVVFEYDSGDVFSPGQIHIRDINIHTQVKGVIGIRIVNGGFDTYENIMFQGLYHPFYIDQGANYTIRNIIQGTYGLNPGGGSWFGSTSQLDVGYLNYLNIDGYINWGNDPAPLDANPDYSYVIVLNRVATAHLAHMHLGANLKTGIRIENDCQGVTVDSTVMSGVAVGLSIGEDPANPGVAPTYLSFTNLAIDQFKTVGIDIIKGANLRFVACDITNGGAISGTIFNTNCNGISIGGYPNVARIDFKSCTINGMQANGIVFGAGASTFAIKQCRFFDIGKSGAGIPMVIPAGNSHDYDICDNEMSTEQIIPYGTIADVSTGVGANGANRRIINNSGAPPVILTQAGTIVVRDGQVQTDGIFLVKKTAVGSPPTNPPTNYANIWLGDDNKIYLNTGTSNIVLGSLLGTDNVDGLEMPLTFSRRHAGTPAVGARYNVSAFIGETSAAKAAFVFQRQAGQGVGDFLWLVDNNADTGEVDLTDAVMRLQSLPSVGPKVGARFAQPYDNNVPMGTTEMPTSSLTWYVDETGSVIKAKIKLSTGLVKNLTTGLPIA